MNKKIMIIDDEPDTLVLVKAILEPEFNVEVFDMSKKALDALKKGSRPDLILLDMRMPVISGPDFCDMVFKDKKNSGLKIIFFTASSDLDKSLAKKHNALGFIFKPFENNELVKQIKKYLSM